MPPFIRGKTRLNLGKLSTPIIPNLKKFAIYRCDGEMGRWGDGEMAIKYSITMPLAEKLHYQKWYNPGQVQILKDSFWMFWQFWTISQKLLLRCKLLT